MNENTLKTVFAGLLHDLGKVLYRAGDTKNHSESGYDFLKAYVKDNDILDCVRYHHSKALRRADISESSPAYIVYIADNIAAGADRRTFDEEEINGGFDRNIPLSSVFNLLNGKSDKFAYRCGKLDSKIPYTDRDRELKTDDYKRIIADFQNDLKALDIDESYINSLLTLLEIYFSFIPSSTSKVEVPDISLFDHVKITAAVAACISEFLTEKNRSCCKEILFDNEKDFYSEKAFLMFTCDFSGIQKFIYNILPENALKSLRSRSFYLEILMEHFIDEILCQAGLSRANLIYSGGGHCYILLPNTEKAKKAIENTDRVFNSWLRKKYGVSLYIASAYRECSGSDLKNEPSADEPYKKIYQDLSAELTGRKMKRYTADELRELNSFGARIEGRECKICGFSSEQISENGRCSQCENFVDISSKLVEKDIIMALSKEKLSGTAIILPSCEFEKLYLCFFGPDEAKQYIKDHRILRAYSKNAPYTGLNYVTNIYMGDYTFDSDIGQLVDSQKSFRRLGVFRADVDNLGAAFTSGFELKNEKDVEKKNRYVTLSRSAAFSRQMSLFFKYYINSVLSNEENIVLKNVLNIGEKIRVNIVYSGGDDLFIIGRWNDVIYSALLIEKAFKKFSLGRLTISGGIGIFSEKYPIYRTASQVAELEECSKRKEGKNALTLFEADTENIYDWKEFVDKVINEKLQLLETFFNSAPDEQDRGNAFLYRLLEFLRKSDKKINLARYAYLLARLEPSDVKKGELYRRFSDCMFKWIKASSDRKQLITAIYIYAYLAR